MSDAVSSLPRLLPSSTSAMVFTATVLSVRTTALSTPHQVQSVCGVAIQVRVVSHATTGVSKMRRSNYNLTALVQRSAHQGSLWGDTYLTPQEARVYLQQMLQTLKATREKNK